MKYHNDWLSVSQFQSNNSVCNMSSGRDMTRFADILYNCEWDEKIPVRDRYDTSYIGMQTGQGLTISGTFL